MAKDTQTNKIIDSRTQNLYFGENSKLNIHAIAIQIVIYCYYFFEGNIHHYCIINIDASTNKRSINGIFSFSLINIEKKSLRMQLVREKVRDIKQDTQEGRQHPFRRG